MLTIQQPGTAERNLLEALVDASSSSNGGGAMFAWASAGGVQALTRDPAFEQLCKRGSFELYVGLDAITDPAAVGELSQAMDRLDGLQVRAFLHERAALFHPKFSWFESRRGVRLIAGSGNLTLGGLTGNWEAYVDVIASGDQARRVLSEVGAWVAHEADHLLDLEDERVLARAKQNAKERRAIRGRRRSVDEIGEVIAGDEDALELGDALVAEIPRGSTRWNQANFDKASYERFFGVRAGSSGRIVLRHVTAAGELGDVESRPGVAVKSHNYRFELAAAAGLPYPTRGRPTAVFVKTRSGVILYRLLMPGQSGHSAMDAFLAERWSGRNDHLRRVATTADELRRVWPGAPIWQVDAQELEGA